MKNNRFIYCEECEEEMLVDKEGLCVECGSVLLNKSELKTGEKNENRDNKNRVFIHESYKFGWFRFSFYRLGWKFCLRFELSSGWDN